MKSQNFGQSVVNQVGLSSIQFLKEVLAFIKEGLCIKEILLEISSLIILFRVFKKRDRAVTGLMHGSSFFG